MGTRSLPSITPAKRRKQLKTRLIPASYYVIVIYKVHITIM